MNSHTLLEVNHLEAGFDTETGLIKAVDGVSFCIPEGSCVGIVGESGCGKSVTAHAIMRLLPQPMGHILGGKILFKGQNILDLSQKELYSLRGREIGMIFQEPMTALNPVQTISKQIGESLILHRGYSKKEALNAAIDLLRHVRIPAPEKRIFDYPHHLSGGMRQRVLIAIALACNPALLIADEPTTALDVTVQAQVLDLLLSLQEERKSSTLLITHDLGVIAESCDHVVVMYAGRVVEQADTHTIFTQPRHAYTRGLLRAIPHLNTVPKSRLDTIPGQVAPLHEHITGCRFCQRMGQPLEELTARPPLVEIAPNHWVELCPRCTAHN